MLLGGGMNLSYLISLVLGVLLLSPLGWRFLASYQRDRILTFINPRHDPLGIGYNAIQSAIAVGSGLLFGRGLGRGVQSQLQFLPERHTDFIFASFSEAFGFLGTVFLLLIFFLLLRRILLIAHSALNNFESLIALGVFAILLSQVFINSGMNLGILPITGVTLPLVSYGGSSLISTMVLLGIVNAIHRNNLKRENTLEIR
jgi:rod shape determining protein RodA